MTAEVVKFGRKYQAYCPEHSDGINTGNKSLAQTWADQHNEKEHGEG